VLYRATGLSDVRVGTNVATRSHPALEDLVGLFVNTLVLRTSLAGEPEPSYADVLDRVRRTVLDALAHQALPFDDLVDTLRREGLVEIEEIFRVLLLQEEAPIAPMFADLEAELLDLEVRAAAGVTLTSCDVIFVIRRDRGGIELQAVYKTSLFDAARIDALLEAFEQALGALCATPDRSIR
jgi:microcystin synthetase protein McyB